MAISGSAARAAPHALVGHCCRMMGSALDADDAVPESKVHAWRSPDRSGERSSGSPTQVGSGLDAAPAEPATYG